MTTTRREFFTGCGMFLFSICAFYYANQLPDTHNYSVSGTGMVPYITTLSMIIMSISKCVVSFKKARNDDAEGNTLNIIKCILVMVFVAFYAFFLEKVGFFISSFCLMLASVPLFGLRNFRKGLVYALVTSLAAWILFSRVFSSYLPIGYLFR